MRLSALLFLLLSLVSHAQGTGPRTCRILFLSGTANSPEKIQLFDGTLSQEVELPRMGFSPIYEVAAGDITLAMLPAPPVDPKVIPSGAPKASVAAGITDFYILVAADPTNQITPLRFQIVNANAENFKRGQMLWFNLTGNKIAGLLGTRKLMMEPNSRTIVDAPASKQEDYHVNIHYLPPGKERSEPICETNWAHDPRSRSVFFVINTNGGKAPRVMGFPDFREAPAENP
jgi:hypothetical protein